MVDVIKQIDKKKNIYWIRVRNDQINGVSNCFNSFDFLTSTYFSVL